MTIGKKLMLSFFAMTLLIGFLGAYALYRAVDEVEHAAQHESSAVAQTVGILVGEYVETGAHPDPRIRAELQEHIMEIKELQKRDIVIVDAGKRILADAVPEEIGSLFQHDKDNEVGMTIADGRIRTFMEKSKSYPQGIRQIVLPLDSGRGKRIGAVILEYTPLYQDILGTARQDIAIFALLYVAALSLAIFIGYVISRNIAKPLATLQDAALKVASGDLSVSVPSESKDELGALAESFNIMTKGLKWSREQQARANDDLFAEIKLRKMADEALCASEEKFRTLFENAADAILMLDMEGNIIDVNRTACEQRGFSKEEMVSFHISELNAPEVNALLQERMSRLRTEGRVILESAHRKKDGSVMPVEVHARVMELGGQKVILSMVRDISERKRAEQALKDAVRLAQDERARTDAIISAIGDSLVIIDREFRIVYQNQVDRDLIGDHVGKVCYEAYEGRSEVCDDCPAVLTFRDGMIHRGERDTITAAGRMQLDITVSPLRDPAGNMIGAIELVRDVTDRRRAEEELRKTNTRLRSLIQTIPDMVIFKDREGRHLLVNKTVEDMTGHSAYEILGKAAEDLMPPGPAAACRTSDETAMASRVPIHAEEQMTAPDGSAVYIDMVKMAMVDDRDNVIGMVAVGRNITDRKRAEDILRESEEKYRELVESVNSIVLRWTSDGRVSFINSFGARFFGYAAGELAGRHVIGSIVPESETTGRDLTAMIRDICQFPERYLNNVNENMRKNGKRVWISWTNKPIVDRECSLVEILSIGNDITERMHAQVELGRHRQELIELVEERTRELSQSNEQLRKEIVERERMEEELIKAQKLESLGVLAGGIAHDFNNLLTSILGNVSVALFDIDALHPAYRELARAERATLRAQELTQQLLTFSKGGAPVRKTAAISDLIRDTAGFALHGGRVKCQFVLPEDLWLVDIDAGQMSQVIHNLIINADHAMPDGGTVSVVGENIELPCDGGPSLAPGRYVKISVQDHGVGIPAGHLAKIFDPYFTTKQRGSGLGLATSYSIIVKHGGSITVESAVGTGTIFSVYLPASSASVEEVRGEDAELQRASGKILIMDDEEDVRETAGSVLRRLGYSVAFAADGARAIELYREAWDAGAPFDVLIMDLNVPAGMGGVEALEHLRAIDPNVRAIVSSGYSNDPIMADYEKHGFAGMVSKPYRIRDLGLVVHRVAAKNFLMGEEKSGRPETDETFC